MSKKYKITGIILIIATLIIATGVCVYIRPEIRLLMCTKNLQKELSAMEQPMFTELQPLTIYQKRQEQEYHDTLDVTISSPVLEIPELSSDTYTMNQLSIAYDALYCNQDKEIKADVGLGIMGFDLLQGKLYVQDDTAYFTIPSVFSNCYYVNLSTLGTDFNQSELAQNLQLKVPESLSVHPFTQETADWENIQDIEQHILEHAKTLKSYVSLKNGSKSSKGTPVTITLDAYAVNDMMHYLERSCLHNALYQDQAEHIFTNEKHRDFFEGIFKTDYTEDVIVNCYMDKKRRLTEVEIVSPISIGNDTTMSFKMKLLGEENSLEDILMTITFAQKGAKKNVYEIERTIAGTQSGVTQNLQIAKNGSPYVSANEEWDSDSKNYQVKIDMAEEEQSTEVSLKGSFLSWTPGEAIDFEIADFYIEENEEVLLRAVGEFTTKVNDGKTVAVEEMNVEHAKAILKMNRAELFGMLYEGVKNMGKSLISGSSLLSLFQ